MLSVAFNANRILCYVVSLDHVHSLFDSGEKSN